MEKKILNKIFLNKKIFKKNFLLTKLIEIGRDFTIMFIENQSASLIMKNRPSPPTFLNFIST